MVTGGWSGKAKLDSTEVLRPGFEWQEITSARLPMPMTRVRVSTVNNRVLLFGDLFYPNLKPVIGLLRTTP